MKIPSERMRKIWTITKEIIFVLNIQAFVADSLYFLLVIIKSVSCIYLQHSFVYLKKKKSSKVQFFIIHFQCENLHNNFTFYYRFFSTEIQVTKATANHLTIVLGSLIYSVASSLKSF